MLRWKPLMTVSLPLSCIALSRPKDLWMWVRSRVKVAAIANAMMVVLQHGILPHRLSMSQASWNNLSILRPLHLRAWRLMTPFMKTITTTTSNCLVLRVLDWCANFKYHGCTQFLTSLMMTLMMDIFLEQLNGEFHCSQTRVSNSIEKKSARLFPSEKRNL